MEEGRRRDTGSENILDHTNKASVAGVLSLPKMPCGHDMNGRNLIVCIDGASNLGGTKNTNVMQLYSLIAKGVGDKQRTYYNSGIGAYSRPSWKSFKFYKEVIHHNIDLAIAWDFERTVFAAYRWLSDNYETGDRIFLFGFSRGAYQVRVLSAMIDKVGLIHKGNEMQIPFAYELYAEPKRGSEQDFYMAERFKRAFSSDVKVHFVGAWDTVSSIGLFRGTRLLPGTVDGMRHVCYFRQALALDERRVKFLPEYAYGSTEFPHTEENSQRTGQLAVSHPTIEQPLGGDHPHTLEVWFAGTHSDIGGSADNTRMDISTPPLRWMVFEARAAGLRTALFKSDPSPLEQIEINETLTWTWWLIELLPIKRGTSTGVTYKPHLGSHRKIHNGQKIHASVVLGDGSYIPKARPPIDIISLFHIPRSERSKSDWVQFDSDFAQHVVEGFVAGHHGAIETWQSIAMSEDGGQVVYKQAISALKADVGPEVKHKLLKSVMDILEDHQAEGRLKLSPRSEIRPLVSDLWMSSNQEYQKISQEFVAQFTDPCTFVLQGHSSWVRSVAFSPDGKHVASGSVDNTIRIWNVVIGEQVVKPLQRHEDWVYSVAFSPDNKLLVSGSKDATIRIWNVETKEQISRIDAPTQKSFFSVAFSPDGQRIASGSPDKTIGIWDTKMASLLIEPLQHQAGVNCVAFSPDGHCIVSASEDGNVWIWDLTTGHQMGQPFYGHTAPVCSIAFSPNGKWIVSGSEDHTVRIWNAETGKQVGEPLRGHDHWVGSVAVSFDNKFVASGSRDGTVRLWEMETGRHVGEPFRGHNGTVFSVAFSPDGKCVASGSLDHTIRIWDVVVWPEETSIQDLE